MDSLVPNLVPNCRRHDDLWRSAGRYRLWAGSSYPTSPMARIVRLLEIDLNGSSFRIELGGHVALADRDVPVAVVRVDTLDDAERLETLAGAMHAISFRWKEGHDVSKAITVDDFARRIAAEPSRFLPEAAIDRLGFRPKVATASKPAEARCDHCGHPVTPGYPCDVCGPVDNNIPGKHD